MPARGFGEMRAPSVHRLRKLVRSKLPYHVRARLRALTGLPRVANRGHAFIRTLLRDVNSPAVIISALDMVDRWNRYFKPARFYTFDLSLRHTDVRLVEELDASCHDGVLVYSPDPEEYLNALRFGFAAGLDRPIYFCRPLPVRFTHCYFKPLGCDTRIYVFNHWAQFHGIKEPIQVHCRLLKQGNVLWKAVKFLPVDGCVSIDSRALDVPSADDSLFQMEAWHPGFVHAPNRFRVQVNHYDRFSSSDHHSTELRIKGEGELVEKQPVILGPGRDVVIVQNSLRCQSDEKVTVSLSFQSEKTVSTVRKQVPLPPPRAPFSISIRDLFREELADKAAMTAMLETNYWGDFALSEWYLINAVAGVRKICGNHLLSAGSKGVLTRPAMYRGQPLEIAVIPVPILPSRWHVRSGVSLSTVDNSSMSAKVCLFDAYGRHVADVPISLDPLEAPFYFLSELVPAGLTEDSAALALVRLEEISRVVAACLVFEHSGWGAMDFVENNAGFAFNNLGYYAGRSGNRKVSSGSTKARTNIMGAFRLSDQTDTGLALLHYSTITVDRLPGVGEREFHNVLVELFRPDGNKIGATVPARANATWAVKLSELFPDHATWNPLGFGWMRVSCYTANIVGYSLYFNSADRTLSCQHLWGG